MISASVNGRFRIALPLFPRLRWNLGFTIRDLRLNFLLKVAVLILAYACVCHNSPFSVCALMMISSRHT